MVNSAWTEENINSIWKCSKKVHRVYPPIGLEKLIKRADRYWDKKDNYQILNASEFKSENNHELILQVLSELKLKIKPSIMDEIRLVLINLSTEEDKDYTKGLKNLVTQLNLDEYVKIYPQCKHANHLEEELVRSSYGIYAKVDDNFGSDIIAGLAAGQIMIVHASGASKDELIETGESQNGYLAKTVEEYVHVMTEALNLSGTDKRRIQKSARRTAEQFSRRYFQKNFLEIIESFFKTKAA